MASLRRRVVHHFLPHFIVDSETVSMLAEPHRAHHRAHGLSHLSLFFYLQILIVFSASLYLVKLKAPQILGSVTFSADQIVTLTNAKRVESGLPALSNNSALFQAASKKAQNMLAEDYWAHYSPSGKTPWSFITAAGYRYVFAGENLARDFTSAPAVVDAWMNSSTHRSNVLDKNFKEIGVAVVDGKLTGHEGILVVQMFGAGVGDFPSSQSLAQVVPSPTPAVEAIVSPEPQASPTLAQALPETQRGQFLNQSATVLASRQFSVAKISSLALVGFIFALFLLEVLITTKRAHVQLRTGVIAHLAILGFILFAVWYAVSGAVL